MRYSTVFKFIAIVLCAASLLGMVGSAAGIVAMTEMGGKSVHERYADQVENRALNYAMYAGQIYASEELGNAPRNLMNQYFGNDWENGYFDWTRVGYTICDSEGNVVQEKTILDHSRGNMDEFTFPLTGRYMKVIFDKPHEDQAVQGAENSVHQGTQVLVMPALESTAVGAVYVDYTDGHVYEWPADGTQMGTLKQSGEETVIFRSNIGELPMGDNWYPNRIVMLDHGGNVVYEARSDTMVLMGCNMDENGIIQWLLPAGTVITAAPAGTTIESGDYKAYDAIPAQGVTVATMYVTYGNLQGEDMGSESMGTPDLIGTLFHGENGNAEFRSNVSIVMDIPADSIITHIRFLDTQSNILFEARCPGGVGQIEYDEKGYMIFRGQMPGTVIPEETEPEVSAIGEGRENAKTYIVTPTNVYAAPNFQAQVLETLENVEVEIVQQGQFYVDEKTQNWCLIRQGWVPLEEIMFVYTPGPAGQTREAEMEPGDRKIYAAPSMDANVLGSCGMEEAPEILRQEVFNGVTWGLTPEGWIVLDEGQFMVVETEPEEILEALEAAEPVAVPEVVAETVSAETLPYPKEDLETVRYYDGQEMMAEYVWEPMPEGYTVTVSLAAGAMDDELVWTLLRLAEVFKSVLLKALGICIAVFALCVVHLSCSAGRTRRNNEVRAGGLNRIPLDLYLGLGALAETGLVFAAAEGSAYFARNDEQLAIIFCGACAYLASLLLVAFFFAFVAQIKTPGGYWWKNTLCGHCLRLVVNCGRKLSRKCRTEGKPAAGNFLKWARRTVLAMWIFGKHSAEWILDTGKRLMFWLISMIGKAFRWTTGKLGRFFGLLPITWQFLTTGFTLVFLLYVMMRTYKVGYILLGFGIFFAVILYAASAFAILLESAKRMSKGDLDTQVDDQMLIGGFREFAERLNDLAGVAVIAAQKQLKSERMKTELITNVSHDIKTPLTSIINYVDLLQKPHTEAQQDQYLEVLDRQSQRLKKLIDDLMEMSKASTGNMSVDIEVMDAAETVNQALGEFADKLDRAQLTPVFRQPEEQILMLADGRLAWRVMSNLLGNAVKYALPGTRIYLDLLQMDGKVIISMKNISREELNVHADELMERFVRGDASRNTEGSGLGLNIAQSLMELQKGQLQILVDGDLFKVTLIFPAA